MQKGLTNIEIETDSQTAMKLIRDGSAANSPYRALIEDANFLLRCCQCTLKAIPKEVNQSADALANLLGSNCNCIMEVLFEFCDMSGQKINFHKSKMYISPNIPRREALPLSNMCGISITTDLGKYLGTPLLHTRVSKTHLQDILDRMAKKLSGWKAKNLSLADRATLVKAVTSSMPNHLMQTMEIPRRVCDQIDKLNRNFLWDNTEDRKKVHLVNWQQVCKSKRNGGLGIRQARVQNLALISKLGWKLTINSDELWCKILKAKYLKHHQSLTSPPKEEHHTLGKALSGMRRSRVRI
ncbi:uncharacterized protein LOC114269469 [Camellia sinensis]|uniref:uncharacterized protein LOC114269469 n=1 Tax=Camellia sinensis TaxID=4442 RepID=UPI001035BDB6|nr:uncharacterized protein LOC114269469 [Camellia sinensis]